MTSAIEIKKIQSCSRVPGGFPREVSACCPLRSHLPALLSLAETAEGLRILSHLVGGRIDAELASSPFERLPGLLRLGEGTSQGILEGARCPVRPFSRPPLIGEPGAGGLEPLGLA